MWKWWLWHQDSYFTCSQRKRSKKWSKILHNVLLWVFEITFFILVLMAHTHMLQLCNESVVQCCCLRISAFHLLYCHGWYKCNTLVWLDMLQHLLLVLSCLTFATTKMKLILKNIRNQTVNLSITVFWDVTSCGLVERDQWFGETYCLSLYGGFSFWRWSQQVPLKC